MRKLLRGMRLPNHQWPDAMDHAVMLHNLLSSSSLPNNASPHLLWTGKLGNTKMLRVFGCMVQYRPHIARAGRFSQRAQWGLHLGIEKHYNAWKIFDIQSKETVAARDVIFYERLPLQTYLDNLAAIETSWAASVATELLPQQQTKLTRTSRTWTELRKKPDLFRTALWTSPWMTKTLAKVSTQKPT
ncbi:unnamed protein product [Closterium sp. NIES-53]